MAWKPDYTDPTALADFIRIDDSLDDDQMVLAISAASRAVERTTRRQFGINDSPVQRFYSPFWSPTKGRWVAEIDDLASTSTVTVTVDGTTVTDYQLTPRNNGADGVPYTYLQILDTAAAQPRGRAEEIEIEATFGWESIPPTIEYATLLQAARFLQRRDAPFGVAGSPDQGSEMRLLAKLDADVEVMLAEFVRPRFPIG